MALNIDNSDSLKFNISNFDSLDEESKETVIGNLSNIILNSEDFKATGNIQSVVSHISNPHAVEKVCHRLAMSRVINPSLEAQIRNLDRDFFCSYMSKEGKMEICLMIPEENRANILKFVDKMGYSRWLKESDKIRLLSIFQLVGPEKLDRFCNYLKTFFGNKVEIDETEYLFKIYKNEGEEFLSSLAKVISNFENYNKVNVIDPFIKIPRSELADFCSSLLNLKEHKKCLDIDYLIKIINILEGFSIEDKKMILSSNKLFDKSRWHPDSIIETIEKYANASPEQRENFQFNDQILSEMKNAGISIKDSDEQIITEISSKISKGDKLKMIDLMNHLPFDQFNGTNVATPGEYSPSYSGSQLKAAITLPTFIATLFLPDLQAFEELNPSSKVQMINLAFSLYKFYGYKALAIIEAAKPFIKKGMNPNEIEQVLSLIVTIPEMSRGQIIRDAKELIDETMSWMDQITTLLVMSKTPESMRTKSLEQAKKYFTLDMSWVKKIGIFLYISEQTYPFDSSLDQKINNLLQPLIKKENTNTIEEKDDLDEDVIFNALENAFAPLPVGSLFSNTDLIIVKDDFKGKCPLNGIKLSELLEIENLAQNIFSGKEKIQIDSKDEQFQKEVREQILTLLTRSIGRELIKSVLNNNHLKPVIIEPGIMEGFHPDSHKITLKPSAKYNLFYGHLANSGLTIYPSIPFINLGHELIHASHYPELLTKENPNLDPLYDNIEEQRTITGFKKDIEWPKSLKSEDWEEEPIYTEENFDRINERNLFAAFANSKNVFYPRYSHRGIVRNDINRSKFGVAGAYPFLGYDIISHITLQNVPPQLLMIIAKFLDQQFKF